MGKESKRKAKRIVFRLCLLGIICIGIYCLGLEIKPEEIVSVIRGAGFWAPVLYVLIMASTFVIAPLSGTPVFFAGYMIFENMVQVYGYFAALLAATINFWIARKWGRDLVQKLVGKKNIAKVDQFTQDYGIKSLIFLRFFQGHLHDFISYAYGLTNIKYLTFMIISTLTPIPWLLFWQLYVFKKIDNIGDLAIWTVITLIPFFIISVVLAFKYRSKYGKKTNE